MGYSKSIAIFLLITDTSRRSKFCPPSPGSPATKCSNLFFAALLGLECRMPRLDLPVPVFNFIDGYLDILLIL